MTNGMVPGISAYQPDMASADASISQDISDLVALGSRRNRLSTGPAKVILGDAITRDDILYP
jgi:hypothetical protein